MYMVSTRRSSTAAKRRRHRERGERGRGAHLLLMPNLFELLRGVVARFSHVAVRRDRDSSGLLETAVCKPPLRREPLGVIEREIEPQPEQQGGTDAHTEHCRNCARPQLR